MSRTVLVFQARRVPYSTERTIFWNSPQCVDDRVPVLRRTFAKRAKAYRSVGHRVRDAGTPATV